MILAHSFRIPISHSHSGMLAEPTHSHEMELEVQIRGALNAEGFVVDYRHMEREARAHVVAALSGRNLDEIFDFPTSENIAIWVWRRLAPHLPLHAVIVRERPDIAAIYHGETESGAAPAPVGKL